MTRITVITVVLNNETTIEDTIGSLLDAAVDKLRDAAVVEKTQIDRICAGLATLRPLIPLAVLASISGVNEAAIRSSALDLGRPVTCRSVHVFFAFVGMVRRLLVG